MAWQSDLRGFKRWGGSIVFLGPKNGAKMAHSDEQWLIMVNISWFIELVYSGKPPSKMENATEINIIVVETIINHHPKDYN